MRFCSVHLITRDQTLLRLGIYCRSQLIHVWNLGFHKVLQQTELRTRCISLLTSSDLHCDGEGPGPGCRESKEGLVPISPGRSLAVVASAADSIRDAVTCGERRLSMTYLTSYFWLSLSSLLMIHALSPSLSRPVVRCSFATLTASPKENMIAAASRCGVKIRPELRWITIVLFDKTVD
jgi:hypothetical protein